MARTVGKERQRVVVEGPRPLGLFVEAMTRQMT
jgi:hypothetical protein